MKLKFGRGLYLLAAVFVLMGVMLFWNYLLPQNAFFSTVTSLVSLVFIFLLPGYILSYLIFEKVDRSEKLILSLGFSICVTILAGMIVHFAQMKISFVHIMYGVLILSLILAISAVLKHRAKRRERPRSRVLKDGKIFLFCSLSLLFAMAVIIYTSISLPSEEEFVELYWKAAELTGLKEETDVNCAIDDCSLSGFYKLGSVNLLDNYYNAIITDLNAEDVYDSICIDFNKNGVYCEKSEGPFAKGDSFGIGSNLNLFSVVLSKSDKFYIFNFPKRTNASNFTVGFSAKSNYKEAKNLNLALFVNETMQYSESLPIEPQQEISKYYPVRLPSAGLYKVKIEVLPLTVEDRTYIEFWVEKE